MKYLAEIGTLGNQYLYLTNISEYMSSPCYFGFMGFSQEDTHWDETGLLLTNVDAYFIGWDISEFGLTGTSDFFYADSDFATFNVENLFPTPTDSFTIWFNSMYSYTKYK